MRRLLRAVPALVIVLPLCLTGCGTGGGKSNTAQQRARYAAFAKCMRAHGFYLPDTPPTKNERRPGAPSAAELAKESAANAACRKYAPAGSGGGGDTSAAEEDHALKLAACLRRQGIDAQDPKNGSADITIPDGYPDKKVQDAYMVCLKQVPPLKDPK